MHSVVQILVLKGQCLVSWSRAGLNRFHWRQKSKVSRSLNESRSLSDGPFHRPCPLAHWTVALWDLPNSIMWMNYSLEDEKSLDDFCILSITQSLFIIMYLTTGRHNIFSSLRIQAFWCGLCTQLINVHTKPQLARASYAVQCLLILNSSQAKTFSNHSCFN